MRPIPDDDLILYLYGESPDTTAIRARAQDDPALAARIEALRAVLDAVSETHQEAAPSDLEDRLWRRLAPEIATESPARQSKVVSLFRRVPRQALAIAATMILIVTAFALGRLSQMPTDPGPITLASDRILLAAVGDHLSRSQILLREVSNASRANELDRLQAREVTDPGSLLADNRLYRQTADQAGQAHVVAVLEALERVLVELANPPTEGDDAHVEALRQRIDDQDLLFKIRVLGDAVSRSIQNPTPRTTAPAGARI